MLVPVSIILQQGPGTTITDGYTRLIIAHSFLPLIQLEHCSFCQLVSLGPYPKLVWLSALLS